MVEQVGVRGENGVVEGSIVEPPAVSYVVDADEEGEERGVGRPGDGRGGGVRAVDREEFGGYLVFEGENGGRVGGHERRVDGGAAVGEVVGQYGVALVRGEGEEADPVGAVG